MQLNRNTSTARVSSRKYFIPGCVGRGLDLDLRIPPAPAAASGNPSEWAQAGPKWVGPRQAQVGGPPWVGPSWAHMGGPKLGPSGWAHAGPKWVGPRRAQVGGPKRGPSGWAHAGPTWVGPSRAQVGGPKLGPSQKFGTPKNQKKNLKCPLNMSDTGLCGTA